MQLTSHAPAHTWGQMGMGGFGFGYVDHPPQGHHRAGLWASAAPTWLTTSSKVNIFHKHKHVPFGAQCTLFKSVKMQTGQFKLQKWIPRVCFGPR